MTDTDGAIANTTDHAISVAIGHFFALYACDVA